jgi:hypothetical protein
VTALPVGLLATVLVLAHLADAEGVFQTALARLLQRSLRSC